MLVLREDLDQIRTTLRVTKGTATWLTAHTPLYVGGADSLEELLTSTQGTGVKSATNPWGYTVNDIPTLATAFTAIQGYTGQDDITDSTPTYSSTRFVTQYSSLENATSELDYQVGRYVTVSGTLTASGISVTAGYLVATTGGVVAGHGDIFVNQSDHGLVVTAPDGKRWRLTINNFGAVTAAVI